MNKKIIGYKLIKPEYVNAVISITGISVYDNPVEFINNYFNSAFTIEGNFIKNLKQARVLDLWFEPIYKEEVIPKYVECIKSLGASYTLGRIYIVNTSGLVLCDIKIPGTKYNSTEGHHSKFKPSTKEAYDAQNQPTSEKLLAEAKRRYPIGTHFKTVTTNQEVICSSIPKFWDSSNDIVVQYNNNYLPAYVYHNGKWAEIINFAKTEVKTEQIFTKEQEDYIKNLINNEIKKLQ
jgi:hypothetical protein